ncbi:MAG: DUF3343 domain-containing protein [Anaerolineae bacterium]
MTEPTYGIVLFHTTSAALRGEKLAKAAGLTVKLIPVPRELASDCGLALRFPWGDRGQVSAVLDEAGLEHAGVYAI